MTAHRASLINGMVLVLLGAWGAFSSNFASPTAFIPVVVGVIILALNNYIKKEDKVMSHIVVVLTFLIMLALIMPLKGAFGRENTMAIVRISGMILSCIYAMVYFIRSFKAARLNK